LLRETAGIAGKEETLEEATDIQRRISSVVFPSENLWMHHAAAHWWGSNVTLCDSPSPPSVRCTFCKQRMCSAPSASGSAMIGEEKTPMIRE